MSMNEQIAAFINQIESNFSDKSVADWNYYFFLCIFFFTKLIRNL